MYASRLRVAQTLSRQCAALQRSFATTGRQLESAAVAPKTTATQTPASQVEDIPEPTAVQQAPNRAEVWSRSQKPRSQAMTGPRFEQTDFSLQPAPYSAMELVHKQPVRWTHDRIVSCDGGGGAGGHPRIFINTDKAEICSCNYCGLPYANEHHRKHLESLPATSYPL
ncbi:NADH:ubiquinone oxidoreductase 18.4kD subunit [Bombardia bombarda]|uniref:NADH:ubiquinone oxidoreductase 18.4kD subunit n=1 Tax=Bombardia bombarda TaxID=252184 RepID=A0AA40C1D8_9PEZI|nr:NADH:ubiquinone oxidoreductase 18.4kD subunit [Bombardia bombarda]